MRQPRAKTHQLGPTPRVGQPHDRDTNEARAWFTKQLRWERRLAQLRGHARPDSGVLDASRDRDRETGVSR